MSIIILEDLIEEMRIRYNEAEELGFNVSNDELKGWIMELGKLVDKVKDEVNNSR